MEIRSFTEDSIKKIYLSPYIEVVCDTNTISLRNVLFMEPVTIPVDAENQATLLRTLDAGLTIDQCMEQIKSCLLQAQQKNADDSKIDTIAEWTLRQMMVRGILE